ncbi:MAG: response regulator [Acidobacteria bacterium]|jgi:DNA-binding NarL/FixJ family response regulator|nr:response regulator [Acidobacteriota bacterium]
MPEKPGLLIVDDDPEVLKSLQIWLKSEGFRVFTAGDTPQALDTIRKQEIAVGLVDLHLKNEDGLRLATELKALDESLKIIVITGYPSYESAIDAMKTGIFDYISKSTENDVILRKLRAAVAERQRERSGEKESGRPGINVILLGHHQLVREGLENFFKENAEYRLLHVYHSYEYVKKGDFNLEAALLLICSSCNQEYLDDAEGFFARLKLVFPNAKPVIINCACDDERKKELLRRGVKGFLPANIGKGVLKKALGCIMGGQVWVSRELSQQLLSELLEDTGSGIAYKKPVDSFNLSDREVEVLKALASGLSNLVISEKLFLSEKTVKTHTHNIFRKMGVKTRTQAVLKGMEFHII